ncbi:hypothetical protein ACFL44_03580 [Gemmatimonadota bacterium]
MIDPDRLLDEVRSDPFDWPSIDIEKLLKAWGFESIEVSEGNPEDGRLYYHPERRDKNVVIRPNINLHSLTITHVIRIIDDLKINR